MEARLSSEMDATNKAVTEAVSIFKLASGSLGALEEKVSNINS